MSGPPTLPLPLQSPFVSLASLSSSSLSPSHPLAVILLNQPLPPSISLLSALWRAASVRLCADGAANRLHDLLNDIQSRLALLPDRIIGDLDSLRQDVRAFYTAANVSIDHLHCQDSTDFGKCLAHLAQLELASELPPVSVTGPPPPATPPAPPHHKMPFVHDIYVLGALGGRFDQTIASVNTMILHSQTLRAHRSSARMFLISNESIVTILEPNVRHTIHCDRLREGPTCGLIPLAFHDPLSLPPSTTSSSDDHHLHARITTTGLRWNLDHSMPSAFGGLVSTSNQFADPSGSDSDAIAIVEVEADKPILWSVEVDLCSPRFSFP